MSGSLAARGNPRRTGTSPIECCGHSPRAAGDRENR